MRLPIAKIYRAFSELDGFTDSECRRLLDRSQVHSDHRGGMGCSTSFVAIIGGLGLGGLVGATIWGIIEATPLHRAVHRHEWLEWSVQGSITLVIVAAGVVMIIVRDRAIRRLLQAQIERTTCPGCRASLLGAERSADSVRCGGCKTVHRLAALDLWGEDLGPPLIVMGRDTVCGACKYPIYGLPIARGVVTCPECAAKTPVVQDGDPVKLLHPARCPECDYPLEELLSRNQAVLCPECGASVMPSGTESRS